MILQVITSPSGGGAEALVREANQRFRACGEVAHTIYFTKGAAELLPGETSFEVGIRSLRNVWYLRRELKAYIKQYDDLVVHAHLTWPFLFVALSAMFLDVRLFYTEHSTNNRRRRLGWFRFLERLVYARYEKIICISEGVLYSLSKWVGPELTKRLVTVPNGARLYPIVERKNTNGRKLRLVSVGSLTAKKNFAVAIKAVAMAKARIGQYVIVGEGVERAALERLIREQELGDIVKLIGWADDVEKYLAAADILLIPSLWEGFGLVAVEGMSTGLPVVASDVDGLREVLEGGNRGGMLISDYANANAWAEALEKTACLLDFANIADLAISSRQQACKFSFDSMVEGYLMEYRKSLGR